MHDQKVRIVDYPDTGSDTHSRNGELEIIIVFVAVDHHVQCRCACRENHANCEAEVLEVDRAYLLLEVLLVERAQLSVEFH